MIKKPCSIILMLLTVLMIRPAVADDSFRNSDYVSIDINAFVEHTHFIPRSIADEIFQAGLPYNPHRQSVDFLPDFSASVRQWEYEYVREVEAARFVRVTLMISYEEKRAPYQNVMANWDASSDERTFLAMQLMASALLHAFEGDFFFYEIIPVNDRRQPAIERGWAPGPVEFVNVLPDFELLEAEDPYQGRFWLARDYDTLAAINLGDMAYALPAWVTDRIDRQWAAQHMSLVVAIDESDILINETSPYSLDQSRVTSKEVGLDVRAYGVNWIAQVTGEQWNTQGRDDSSMFIEAGAIRRVFSGKIDLYGMYRLNLLRRQESGTPLSEQERRELLKFGARYYLNRGRNVHATIDLIYSFDKATQGIRLNDSDNGIGIRAGFQYLF